MKNNNKFRLDVWGFITLAMIALYLVFMIYPMGYLIRQSVWDAETGAFTWANFAKFFSKSYYFDTLFNSFKVSILGVIGALISCSMAASLPAWMASKLHTAMHRPQPTHLSQSMLAFRSSP